MEHSQHAHSVGSAVSCYLDTLSVNGRRAMRDRLKQTATVLGMTESVEQIDWHALTYEQLVAARSILVAQGKAASTINLTLSALRSVFKTAMRMGLMDGGMSARLCALPNVREQRRDTGQALSHKEIRKLLSVCRAARSRIGQRDALILQLMAQGGLRRAEVAALRTDHYDSKCGELHIIGKGNKQRTIYLSGELRTAMRNWIQQLDAVNTGSGTAQALFVRVSEQSTSNGSQALSGQAVYDIVLKRGTQAGFVELRPHDLRRSYITNLLRAGVDLHTVSKMAGHAGLSTTALYDKRGVKAQQQASRLLAQLQ